MHKAKILMMLAALTIPLTSREAHGQQITSPYDFIDYKKSLGPLVGYIFGDAGSANLGPQGGPVAGLQFALALSGPLTLSIYGSYYDSWRAVMDPRTDEGLQKIGETNQDLLLIAGRMNLNFSGARTWNNLSPYFYLGIGIAINITGTPTCLVDVSDPTCDLFPRDRFDMGTNFMGQFGIGTIWLPTRRFGVRLTIDDSIWRLQTPPGYFDEGVDIDPVPPSKDWTNNIQINLTFAYWF
jgi:hypothetical protein